MPQPDVTIAYAAHGGSAGTDAALDVDADGTGRMFLGSTMSLPPAGELDRVGTFEGPLAKRTLSRLVELVSGLPTELPEAGTPVPGSVVRSLVLTVDGGRREITIPGYAPAPLDEIERLLQEAMVTLVDRPSAAVSVSIEVAAGAPTLVVRSVGSGPAIVRFVDGDGRPTAGGTVAVLGPDFDMLDTLSLDPATVTAHASPGPTELAPGDVVRFPLPAPANVPGSAATLSGGLEFDLERDGRLQRVSVQADDVAFPR